MRGFEFPTLADAYVGALRELRDRPVTPSRDGDCREIVGASFAVYDMTDVCGTHSPERQWSLQYFAGELAWYLSGSCALAAIRPYAKFWDRCSDDGVTLNSAYGSRIFGSTGFPGDLQSQWARVEHALRQDLETRRAVLHFADPRVSLTGSRDVPCTTSLQFVVRGGQLHAIATMRSNDVYLGLAYDAPFFVTLAHLMAQQIGVEVGEYHHQAGSLHYYLRDEARVDAVLDSAGGSVCFDLGAPSVDGVCAYVMYENTLRSGGSVATTLIPSQIRKYKFWSKLADALGDRWLGER